MFRFPELKCRYFWNNLRIRLSQKTQKCTKEGEYMFFLLIKKNNTLKYFESFCLLLALCGISRLA